MTPNTFALIKATLNEYLAKKGLRRTEERYAILKEIYSREDHFEAEELYLAMKVKNFIVSRATVYNTLDLLVDCDLVIKHQFGNKISSRYEKAFERRQHDHLVCTDCQRVSEFCDPRLMNIQKMVGELMEADIHHHSLTFYASCLKKNCEHRKNAPEISSESNRKSN